MCRSWEGCRLRSRWPWGLVVGVALAGCLPDGRLKQQAGHEPLVTDDGWQVETPAGAGFDPIGLDAVYERWSAEDAHPTVRSLLIVRGGKLVAEAYELRLGRFDRAHPVYQAPTRWRR